MDLIDHGTLIEPIRSASRQLVRELGFMKASLAETSYSPACVHSLVEIGSRGPTSLTRLSLALRLDVDKTKEALQTLLDAAEVESHTEDGGNGRVYDLTPKGRQSLEHIHAFASNQVQQAIGRIPLQDAKMILAGLQTYAAALNIQQSGQIQPLPSSAVEIAPGFRPGIVGRAVEMQVNFYTKQAGFGPAFEVTMASGLADLLSRHEHKGNQAWTAVLNEKIVGTVFIDGQELGGNKARLRAFYVEDGIRGGGIGRKLLTQAVEFCDEAGFQEIHLSTLKGLHAARKLYEALGFVLEEEYLGTQWGTPVMEQKFVRKAGSTSFEG